MSIRMRLIRIAVSMIVVGLVFTPGITLSSEPSPQSRLSHSSTVDPAVLLRGALQKAQAAGSYRLTIDVQQTVTVPGAVTGASSAMRVEGEIAGPRQARLVLKNGGVRTSLLQDPLLSASSDQEMLITGDSLYQREGDRWVKQPETLSAPGLTGDGLLLLEVAADPVRLEPTETLGGTFERVSFTLNSRDVLRFMLRQAGKLDEQTELQLAISGLNYGGTGELWIDGDGFPARLSLDLALSRGGSSPYQGRAASDTIYTGFGERFPASRFDPTLGPLSNTSTAPIPGLRATAEQLSEAGVGLVFLAVALLFLLLLRRGRLPRMLHAAVTIALVVSMIAPVIAQAAPAGNPDRLAASEGRSGEVEALLETVKSAGSRQRARVSAEASGLDDQADEDGDGLPNGYELKLGTNPFMPDTDLDGLTDAKEVQGVPCQSDSATVNVETDPLNPDSNSDGIRDGDEADRGVCRFTTKGHRPYSWDDDNDSDGVPDSLDLSPFTVSLPFTGNGANLTLETMGGAAGAMSREVYYFELQVVPVERRLLQYAYKSALLWPMDGRGQIGHDPHLGTTGALEVAPYLEVTLVDDDLPGAKAMSDYGVGAAPVPTAAGLPSGQSQLVIPLVPIERGGIVYALQAKVFQDRPSVDGVIRWRDARLKWVVQGDVLRPDENGDLVPSPTGKYGLMVYEEPYNITGVRSSRQAGASSLVAGPTRDAQGDVPDAGPIAMLRGALESQYLGGRLSLGDIYTRFGPASTANITATWGITQSFSMTAPADFKHVDEMLFTTSVTMTRSVLSGYPVDSKPTLLIATEQRTATLNVDKLPDPDFSNLMLNLCLTQIITSRTLKLASYKWDPNATTALAVPDPSAAAASAATLSTLAPAGVGDWAMMGLEEVLAEIRAQFEEIYGTLEEYYNETVGILQMAMTVWYQGQTVVQSIGDLDLTDVTDSLSDPTFYADILRLLDQYGLFDGLPSEFRTVVDFLLGVLEYPGGPLQWLEDQWNTVVTLADEVVGSFKEFAPGEFSLDSLISFTETAINVLTWLASILDLGFLGDVIKVLYRLLEIFKQVQALWNVIQVLVVQGVQAVTDVLTAITSELTSLSGGLQFVGLLFSIVSTLFSALIQIASGTLSVLGVIGTLLKAIVEIAVAIVLFVVATIFPIGTIVSIAIGVINAITALFKKYLGDVGEVFAAILDPLGAILSASNPDPESLVYFLGSPRIGEMEFKPIEGEPLGGIVAGDRIGFEITGTITMASWSNASLNESYAWLQLGRYAGGESFEMCGFQAVQFIKDTGQIDGALNLMTAVYDAECVQFSFDHEEHWTYSHAVDPLRSSRSEIYLATELPGYDVPLPVPVRARDYDTTAWLHVYPPLPRINGIVSLDLSIMVSERWENCGSFGVDCDRYNEQYTTPPSAAFVFFDILPEKLVDLWDWNALTNYDPDGDGLAGNRDQSIGGYDNIQCENDPNAYLHVDSDDDGLSDSFEIYTLRTSSCKADSDDDGLADNDEFVLGTNPRDADTDGDGLKDGEEVARWVFSSTYLTPPWRLDMAGAYAGLRNDPAAYSNPRIANADRDGRSDRKEKQLASSPNAFNLSDIHIAVTQELVEGGGTRIELVGSPWTDDLLVGLKPKLTLTLPIAFSGVTTSARFVSGGYPWAAPTTAKKVLGLAPNTYAWTFPPLTVGRMVEVVLTGLPQPIPPGEVFANVEFTYTEDGVMRQTSDSVPLLLNRGGPAVSITVPTEGSATSGHNGPIHIQGTADDPEGIRSVRVCITTGAPCTDAQWRSAAIVRLQAGWMYDWAPPADGSYIVYARAVDSYGVAGPNSAPIAFHVDSLPPESARFALDGTAYVSTTLTAGSLAAFTVTGEIADAPGAYWSGVGTAVVSALQETTGGIMRFRAQAVVEKPGEHASPFAATFSLPMMPLGGAAASLAQGHYQLTVGATDRAGNVLSGGDTLDVVVDDTAPYAVVRVPQTVLSSSLTLAGRVDETALSPLRLSHAAYPVTQTMDSRDTLFDVEFPEARSYVVGDLNGDTLDDIVLTYWTAFKPAEFGIFFGRTDGLGPALGYTDADVRIIGEDGSGAVAPAVAINSPEPLDVNGDAMADLLIGDPNAAGGAGRAYLLLGRRNWPTTLNLASADWLLSVGGATAFGSSAAGAGDIDGDGLGDILVGAVNASGAQGKVYGDVAYLYLGQERGVPPVTSRIVGRLCTLGCTPLTVPNLAGVGDTDGDGLSDWLLAGYSSVWLVGGQPRDALPISDYADSVAIATLQGVGTQQTVAPAGDVDGDGLRDMLIGDPLATDSRVFLVTGRRPERAFPSPLDLLTGADLSFLEPSGGIPYPPIGTALAPMGDLDRDGKDDFAFGQVGFAGGVAIVLSGRIRWALNLSPDMAAYAVLGPSPSAETGAYVSSGDVDGDMVRDLMVGAPDPGAGTWRGAYLFRSEPLPVVTAGISSVEIGITGPITVPGAPVTATLPAVWVPATLSPLGTSISTFTVPITFAADGDYRIYARATDRAGNRLSSAGWYVGTAFVNRNALAHPDLSLELNEPELYREGFLRVVLSGKALSEVPRPVQALRVYNGERWLRQPLTGDATASFIAESNIECSDQRAITFRAVARDAYGNVKHEYATVVTDTLVAAPQLFANLPAASWKTDITPTLVITWPAVIERGTTPPVYASIDQITDTVPADAGGGVTQVSRQLDQPGAWYAHARIVDAAGNQQVVHEGPFGVNRTKTYSAILPDGWLDFSGGEYPSGMASSYDPYADTEPALLQATWDATQLYVSFTEGRWSPDRRLELYLDTGGGGSSASIGLGRPVHVLPFAADYALVIDGVSSRRLYAGGAGGWTGVSDPLSAAAAGSGTEIAFSRAEAGIGSNTPVAMLAYVDTADGVAAVIPASARPATTPILSGTLAFADAIHWSGLTAGYPASPADLPVQRIAPIVSVDPGEDTHLMPGDTAHLSVAVTNPDVLAYRKVMTLTLGATAELLKMVSVHGATPVDCDAGATRCAVRILVEPGATRVVSFTIQAIDPPTPGLISVPVSVEIADQGLPAAPQAPATASYTIDGSVARVRFGAAGAKVFARSGALNLPIFANLAGCVTSCSQTLSINRGDGVWEDLGRLGSVLSVGGTVPSGFQGEWQVRVAAPNGQTSITSIAVQADDTAPTVAISTTAVLTEPSGYLRGSAFDASGSLRAVEVSLNGGPFRKAWLSGDGLTWRLPLNGLGADGKQVPVSVRAVDSAGNASGPSLATVVLDTTGPVITFTASMTSAAGTVSDGSGVASAMASLDGGATYQPVVLSGGNWSFDYGTWAGGAPVGVIVVRARDIYGNVSQAAALTEEPDIKIYLPLVRRGS